jgi:hypothetical protein
MRNFFQFARAMQKENRLPTRRPHHRHQVIAKVMVEKGMEGVLVSNGFTCVT